MRYAHLIPLWAMRVLKNLYDRRQIGAYYTPAPVADILCAWAITRAKGLVLEPSFGGCEFLDSSLRRLEQLGCTQPEQKIFGCDIDPQAFEYLARRPRLVAKSNFIQRDFLQVTPADFGVTEFDVVIGNPPYVRHQKLDAEQKRRAQEIRRQILPGLNLQASLWGLFLIHSSRFLADGGRFAWLLPSSFTYSDYAKDLRRYMRKHFEELKVIGLSQRLFEQQGAMEGTVVVAAAGWNKRGYRYLAPVQQFVVSSIEDLRGALFGAGFIKRSTNGAYERLRKKSTRLGDYCSFQIGVVTGDTAFFLLNRDQAMARKLAERNLRYIVAKSSSAPGLAITRAELRRAYDVGGRVKVFDPPRPLSRDAVRYIASMPPSAIAANLTFNKRPIWYRPLDRKKSDAFFAGMSHHGPRLVLNQSAATCTNSLYRVTFKSRISERARSVLALSLLSSFSQLSAERVGRAYSAGMLKHEPSDAAKIQVLMPLSLVGLRGAFAKADLCLRSGKLAEAREISDEFLMSNGTMRRDQCAELRDQLAQAREARLVGRAKAKLLDNTKNSSI